MSMRAAVSVFDDRKNNADHVKKKKKEHYHLYDGFVLAALSVMNTYQQIWGRHTVLQVKTNRLSGKCS